MIKRRDLQPFLQSSLTFAISQVLGKELSLIERLKSWDIDTTNIPASSPRKLPDKMSMPAALDGLKPSKLLNVFSRDVPESGKVKSFNTYFQICKVLAH